MTRKCHNPRSQTNAWHHEGEFDFILYIPSTIFQLNRDGHHEEENRRQQGIFCPSLGAEFRPHSQSKIATFFPNTMSVFPN